MKVSAEKIPETMVEPLSSAVAPLHDALAYRELLPPFGGSRVDSRVGSSGAENAVLRYLSGSVPEQGTLPAETINRMIF
jgi:hypothetical protein